MNCLQCNNPLPPDAALCPRCGSVIGQEDHEGISLPGDIVQRTQGFVGRHWVLDEMLDWLERGEERFLIITGEPGAGKTALAAWLAGAGTPPEDAVAAEKLTRVRAAWTATHFCSAIQPGTLDPTAFTQSLIRQIVQRFPAYADAVQRHAAPGTINIHQHVNENPGTVIGLQVLGALTINASSALEVYNRAMRAPLADLCAGAPALRIVILVDALDEALSAGRPNIVTLLAGSRDLPACVRFVLTSRNEPNVLEQFSQIRRIDLSDPRLARHVEADIRTYVVQRLNEPDSQVQLATAGPAAVETLVTRAAGNFLYVRFLLDEVAAGHRSLAQLEGLPSGLYGLYRDYLYRLLPTLLGPGSNDIWSKQVRPLLGRLSVAATAVPATLLADWIGRDPDEVQAWRRNLAQVIERVPLGADGAGYQLYHRSVADFLASATYEENGASVENRFYIAPQGQHERIGRYYLHTYGDYWDTCDVYGMGYTVMHLVRAVGGPISRGKRPLQERLAGALVRLLNDFGFLEAKAASLGTDRLLADVRMALDVLPSEGDLAMLLRVLDREAHTLRGWSREQHPAFFAQQLHNRAVVMKLTELTARAASRLQHLAGSHLALVWRTDRQSGALVRILNHEAAVTVAAVASDGSIAVSGADNGTVKVWNLQTGQTLHILDHSDMQLLEDSQTSPDAGGRVSVVELTLGGEHHRYLLHMPTVTAVAVMPDGRRAIAGTDDGLLKVWDLVTEEALHTLAGHDAAVTGLVLVPHRDWLISASRDRTLKVWDLATRQVLHTLVGHDAPVTALAVTPDGQHALSAGDDGTLKVWDIAVGQPLYTHHMRGRQVTAVVAMPQRHSLISAARDGTLIIWDFEREQALQTLTGRGESVTALAVAPDGRLALAGSSDGTLTIWDFETRQLQHTIAAHEDAVTAVVLIPDGQYALSASRDGTLKIWDLQTRLEPHSVTGHTIEVTAVAVTPDGRRAISAAADGTLKLWDATTGRVLQTLANEGEAITAVALMSDGHHALSADKKGLLSVWDLQSGQASRTFADHADPVTAVGVMPAGGLAISGSQSGLRTVWDLAAGEAIYSRAGHSAAVTALAVTPDGRLILSASEDHTLKVWDFQTGQDLHTLVGHGAAVTAVAVMPDGNQALSASRDCTLKVWDLRTGQALHTLAGYGAAVTAVAVMPDGRRAIAGTDDGLLKVWDLVTGEALHTLAGHDAAVTGLVLVPHRDWLISASRDRTLKVWDLATGQVLRTLRVRYTYGFADGPVTGLAVTPNGQCVIASFGDCIIQFWELATGESLGAAGFWNSQCRENFDISVDQDIPTTTVATSPDGNAVIWGTRAGTLKVFDLQTDGFPLSGDLTRDRGTINAVAILPDGQHALTANRNGIIKLWDITTGQAMSTRTGHDRRVYAYAVTAAPDSHRALWGTKEGAIIVWDLTTGQVLGTLEDDRFPVWRLGMTPDGHRAIAAYLGGAVQVWDLETWQSVRAFTSDGFGGAAAVSLAGDGHQALVAFHRIVELWDIQSGQTLAKCSTDGEVKCAATSLDGHTVIVGDGVGDVYCLQYVQGDNARWAKRNAV
jgi:WD40 repeat protein